MADKLTDQHLADLHERAARLGIPGYRTLRRPQLVAEIESRGDVEGSDDPSDAADPAPAVEKPERGGRKPERRKKPERGDEDRERERLEETETEEVTGVLEVTSQRHGFLRSRGLESEPDDVYVSASQIRRCELRSGDEVAGPARSPRRGERHRALVHVDSVNGSEPSESTRPAYEELTPILPKRRLPLDGGREEVLLRAVDLLAPLALGQRVLVMAAPRSGRTTLLRSIAAAATGAEEALDVVVLLIDERPEEATAWREAVPGAAVASATAEMAPKEQVRVAGLALERGLRLAEAGRDVVLIVDSLSRLAVASGDVADVKRLFGSGRELAEDGAGSMTVIATVVEGAEDDGTAERAVVTTESSLIKLDLDLAAAGVFPALRAGECRVSNEDDLRSPEELAAIRRLRSLLADLDPAEAAALLRERIEGSASNAALLAEL